MSIESPRHPSVPDLRAVVEPPRGSAPRPQASRLTRAGKSSALRTPPARPRVLLMALLVAVPVALGIVWSLLAQRELQRAGVADQTAYLERVRATFAASRASSQSALQALCRVMVEDPRLKATLASGGVDAATMSDILDDLGALRGTGFLMVLSPEGRVFAESGADELQGLDLSSSSIVKRATNEPGAAVGSWALGGQVMDLSITAIRYDDHLVAYLVVGQSLGDPEMASLAAQCGCDVASTLGNELAATSSTAPARAALFAGMAGQPGEWRGRPITAGGTTFVTTAVELGDLAQSHRLLLARAVGGSGGALARLRWLLWFPPALLLVAALLGLAAARRPTPRSA